MANWEKLLGAVSKKGEKVTEDMFHVFAKSDAAEGLLEANGKGAYNFINGNNTKNLKDSWTSYIAANKVGAESKKVVEGATEQVVEDLSRPIARSKGDKFYTESLNNQKLSEAEIAKFRKEQELYNQTVGEGTKHSAESREFDFSDKRKLDQAISERGKDYNNTDNALQLQLNERMRKAAGDGDFATKKEKIVAQSAFNNTKAMDEYMTKNNIKNISNDEAIKINEVKDNLRNKHGDKIAKAKEKEAAAANLKENKEKVGGFMNKAIPTAIGGGLIFSMFSNKGQMSNSELYGQQRPYGQ